MESVRQPCKRNDGGKRMKIIVTKEELLDLCSRCAEKTGDCTIDCLFKDECNGAYIDFWRDNTEIKE